MIKILVIEDDSDKLRRVLAALQAPGCDLANIDVARDATDGKRRLHAQQYDLLVLDVAIPPRVDQMPGPENGMALLEEIVSRESKYFRPREIVGITAYDDILEKATRRFAEDLWQIIHYDPTSDNWAEQLSRKVAYIMLGQRSQPIEDYGYYLGIVVALSTPELKSVLELPWNWSRCDMPSDAASYYSGILTKDGAGCQVVAVAAPQMGMTAASITSMKLISAFRPRYLAMVGITAGITGRCALGDIIAVERTWDWGSGKFVTGDFPTGFQIAPYQLGVDSFIRGKLGLMSEQQATFDMIRRSWKGSAVDRVLHMRLGPVASGASVVASRLISEGVLNQHRKLLAIEMETYAVFAAGHEATLPQPKVFALKSVCDFADESKDDNVQEYAAFTSAQALKIFVENYL